MSSGNIDAGGVTYRQKSTNSVMISVSAFSSVKASREVDDIYKHRVKLPIGISTFFYEIFIKDKTFSEMNLGYYSIDLCALH